MAISIAFTLLAQEAKPPIFSSHDSVDGPFAGEYHVEDLQLFPDGRVVFIEGRATTVGAGKPERSAYEGIIDSDEMLRLIKLLDSQEIRSLPEKVNSKTRPVDFFWLKSLEIRRPDGVQRIQIENFYPFLNLHESAYAYPRGLIELECNLKDIKATIAKRQRADDEDDWCKALLSQGTSSMVGCRVDEGQPKIVAAEGWGPVRIGAPSKTVDAFLGEG
jgi:hypothetical protein